MLIIYNNNNIFSKNNCRLIGFHLDLNDLLIVFKLKTKAVL